MSIGGISGSMPDFSSMRANMEAKMAERFASDDADGSGGLSLSEFSEAHKNGPPGGAGGPGGPGGPGGAANVAGSQPSVEELFAGLDGDGDGEVTQEEFAAAKPPAPHGDFASDTMATLLSAQEESSSSSILELLEASSEEASEVSEEDLVSEFLESLDEDEDA